VPDLPPVQGLEILARFRAGLVARNS